MNLERKFLLEYLPLNIEKFDFIDYECFFIATIPEIKLEKKDNDFYLIKNSLKKQIDEKTYYLLQEYKENEVIKKTIYFIPMSSRITAEIDVYKDIDLKTVRVNFNDENELKTFEIPNWFKEEVTNNNDYNEFNLINNGHKMKIK